MNKRGIVYALNEGYAAIVFIRETACGGECSSCKGCESEEMTVYVPNTVHAKIGDIVNVLGDEGTIARAGNIAYLVPLMTFLIGCILFCFLGSFFSTSMPEALAVIGGIIGILSSKLILNKMDLGYGKAVQDSLRIEIIYREEK